MGRRDVAFWRTWAADVGGPCLEFGCGTGRLLAPLARQTRGLVGIDRSRAMLARARRRVRRLAPARRPALVLGDIRSLPLSRGSCVGVFAPYGVLQSLTSDADLDAALREAARVLRRRGRLAIDLVPDLPAWRTYARTARFRGYLRGRPVALFESVRQDRRRGLTIFDEEFVVGAGRARQRHRFSLTFRTIPMETLLARITRAGFAIDAVQGDYRGAVWTPDADAWIIQATRR